MSMDALIYRVAIVIAYTAAIVVIAMALSKPDDTYTGQLDRAPDVVTITAPCAHEAEIAALTQTIHTLEQQLTKAPESCQPRLVSSEEPPKSAALTIADLVRVKMALTPPTVDIDTLLAEPTTTAETLEVVDGLIGKSERIALQQVLRAKFAAYGNDQLQFGIQEPAYQALYAPLCSEEVK